MEVKMFTCKSCQRERPESHNCGGDCVYCLAAVGDPDATKAVFEEIIKNGGFRGIDSILGCYRTEDGAPEVESTEEQCHLCKMPVWASVASKAAATGQAAKDGGKCYFVCMECLPDDLGVHELVLDPRQKEEMLAAGFDIDKLMADTGKTLKELGKEVLDRQKHQKRAKQIIKEVFAARCKGKGPDERS